MPSPCWTPRVVSDENLVDVAPCPVMPRFDRPHERVARFFEMLPCMAAPGRIAAADVSTRKAHSQLRPGISFIDACAADTIAGRRRR